MLSYAKNAITQGPQKVRGLIQQWDNWNRQQTDAHAPLASKPRNTPELKQSSEAIETNYDKQRLLSRQRTTTVAKNAPLKPTDSDVRISNKTKDAVITHSRSVYNIPEHGTVSGTDKRVTPGLKSRSLRNIAYLTSNECLAQDDECSNRNGIHNLSTRKDSSNDNRRQPSTWETNLSSTKASKKHVRPTVPIKCKTEHNAATLHSSPNQYTGKYSESPVPRETDIGDGTRIATASSDQEHTNLWKTVPNSESDKEKDLLPIPNSTNSINSYSSKSSVSTVTGTTGLSKAAKMRRRARSASSNKGENMNPHRPVRSKSTDNGLDRGQGRYQSEGGYSNGNGEQIATLQTDFRHTDHQSSSSGVASDMSSGEIYRQSRTQKYVNSLQPDPRASQRYRTAVSGGSSAAGINQSHVSIASTDRQQIKASVKTDTMHILEMYTDKRTPDTKRLAAAKCQLEKKGLLVIIGEDGDGTTQMGYDIMAASRRQPYLVAGTSDYLCCIENEENGIAFADDVFGKTFFDKPRYDKWMRLMHPIMSKVKKGTVQLIMIIRSNIEQYCKEFLNDRQDYIINLSESNHRLTVVEMKDIFKQSAAASESLKITFCDSKKDENIKANQGQNRIYIAESTVDEIARVALPSGYPKAVKRFVSTRENLSRGVQYFSRPDEKMCSMIDSWRTSYKRTDMQKYLALLCVCVHGGMCDLNDLDYLRYHISKSGQAKSGQEYKRTVEKLVGCSADQNQNPTRYASEPTALCTILLATIKEKMLMHTFVSDIRCGAKSLNGVYLKHVGRERYKIAAECVEIAVTLSCGQLYPREVIRNCNNSFLCSYIGPDRAFIDDTKYIPIRVDDINTCEALADRIKREIIQGNVELMAGHTAMRDPQFVDLFFRHLKSEKKMTWDILCRIDKHSKKTLVSHASQCILFEIRNGYPKCLAEWILTHKKWMQKRKSYTQAAAVEREVLEQCCKSGLDDSYFNLVEKLQIPVTTACLLNAVESGCLPIVEDLVTIRPSPFKYAELCKALQLACLKYRHQTEENRMALIAYLTKLVSIDYKVKDLESIIHIAGRTGSSCLLGIIDTFNGDMNLINSEHLTCLHLAAVNKYAGVTAFAIDHGACQRKGDRDNQLPIHKAAQFDSVVVAHVLFTRDRDVIAMADSNGQEPLHIAAKFNNVAMTKFLIKNGANKDAKDNIDQTPLHLAAKSGYAEALHFLVDANANLKMKDTHGHCPLQVACLSRNTKAIKRLMKVKDKLGNNSFACLKCIVDNNDKESLAVCVSNGFSVNDISRDGLTLLHHGISVRSPLVPALIDMGADVTQKTHAMAPVHLAAQHGDVNLLKLLCDKGADMGVETSNTKDTTLHIATTRGNTDCLTVILSHYNGGLVEARNKRGETALHLAAGQGNVEICKVLLDHGASTSAMTKRWERPVQLAELGMRREDRNRNRVSDYRTVIQMLSRKRSSSMVHLESAV